MMIQDRLFAAMADRKPWRELTTVLQDMTSDERKGVLDIMATGDPDPRVCEWLFENGVDPNQRNSHGVTFVDNCAVYILESYGGIENSESSILDEHLDSIRVAVAHGASPCGSLPGASESALDCAALISRIPIQCRLLACLGQSLEPALNFELARGQLTRGEFNDAANTLKILDSTRRSFLLHVLPEAREDSSVFECLVESGADPDFEVAPSISFRTRTLALSNRERREHPSGPWSVSDAVVKRIGD